MEAAESSALRRFQRLRTASSERPGSMVAICRHRQPCSMTARLMYSSSPGDHSFRSALSARACGGGAGRRECLGRHGQPRAGHHRDRRYDLQWLAARGQWRASEGERIGRAVGGRAHVFVQSASQQCTNAGPARACLWRRQRGKVRGRDDATRIDARLRWRCQAAGGRRECRAFPRVASSWPHCPMPLADAKFANEEQLIQPSTSPTESKLAVPPMIGR
eukprot:scaffold116175_cov28-Tisochrysis_lutea.AAC.3